MGKGKHTVKITPELLKKKIMAQVYMDYIHVLTRYYNEIIENIFALQSKITAGQRQKELKSTIAGLKEQARYIDEERNVWMKKRDEIRQYMIGLCEK